MISNVQTLAKPRFEQEILPFGSRFSCQASQSSVILRQRRLPGMQITGRRRIIIDNCLTFTNITGKIFQCVI